MQYGSKYLEKTRKTIIIYDSVAVHQKDQSGPVLTGLFLVLGLIFKLYW